MQGGHERGNRRLRGDEPATDPGMPFGVGDGVDESTHRGDHRDRAVAHGLHLGQTAGFEPARHHEEVGSGEHEMGEALVVALYEGEPITEAATEDGEAIGEVALSRSEHGEPQGELIEDRHHRLEQVDPLLIGEPGHAHREQTPVVGETEPLEKGDATRLPTGEIGG